MDFELTDDEIIWLHRGRLPRAIVKSLSQTISIRSLSKVIAKYAQRKLMKHLHEKCYKHDAGLLRLGCPECLRELRKEIGM